MIVKLKCVSNIDFAGDISEYLTIGKIYDAVKCSGILYRITGDDGEGISVLINGCAHAKWEVVN